MTRGKKIGPVNPRDKRGQTTVQATEDSEMPDATAEATHPDSEMADATAEATHSGPAAKPRAKKIGPKRPRAKSGQTAGQATSGSEVPDAGQAASGSEVPDAAADATLLGPELKTPGAPAEATHSGPESEMPGQAAWGSEVPDAGQAALGSEVPDVGQSASGPEVTHETAEVLDSSSDSNVGFATSDLAEESDLADSGFPDAAASPPSASDSGVPDAAASPPRASDRRRCAGTLLSVPIRWSGGSQPTLTNLFAAQRAFEFVPESLA